jgi:membrane protease YdiL (CAAX protease family)
MYIGSFVGNYVMALASEIVGYDYNNMLESVIDDNNLWVTAIFTVVIAPIGEEFVFRKLIIDRTAKYGCFISVML